MLRTPPAADPPPISGEIPSASPADDGPPDWLGPPAPHWDGRRLWLGDRVLAVFGPADPPAAVLAAFEAGCRWADGRVPDPLPARPGEAPDAALARLAAAVGALNRALPADALRLEVVGGDVLCAGAGGCDPGPGGAAESADAGRRPLSPGPEKTNGKKLMDWGYHGRPVGAI